MDPSGDTKRPRRTLIGYLISGLLGWILVVGLSVLVRPRFFDDGETAVGTLLLAVIGFGLGATIYQALNGRKFRFGLRALLAGVLVVAVVCGLVMYWDYLPGTLYFDAYGFPHGTGWRQYYYDSGQLMIEEHYRAGVPDRTTWYKPNGDIIATTIWDKNRVNIGYFLYQDGSIREKAECRYSPEDRMYLADENRVYYAPDGSVEREYRDGQEVTPK